MKPLKCLLGFHDWFAIYPPLILVLKKSQVGDYAEQVPPQQYITVKRICIHCKAKEEYMVKLSGKLEEWDVTDLHN
jgi:hypothetical protein